MVQGTIYFVIGLPASRTCAFEVCKANNSRLLDVISRCYITQYNHVHRGALYTPEKALKMGLVDELANDKADAIEKCKEYLTSFENIPRKNEFYYCVSFISLYLYTNHMLLR